MTIIQEQQQDTPAPLQARQSAADQADKADKADNAGPDTTPPPAGAERAAGTDANTDTGEPSDALAVDAQKKAELKRMKRLALGLLLAMAVIFVFAKAFEQDLSYLSYIRAFAEAAMVGALADWFAVTALFRHPMGLPIPHTAIIPQNKDRIGEALGRFIQNNFLKPELVDAKLKNVDLAGSVGRWLTDEDSNKRLAERVSKAIPQTLNAMQDETTARFVHQTVTNRMASVDLKPLVTNLLTTLTQEKHHHALFNSMLELSYRLLHENKELIRDRIHDRSNWYIPKTVDDRIYDAILGGLDDTLIQLRDPQSELRHSADDAVTRLVMDLAENDAALARVNDAKVNFLKNDRMKEYFSEAWAEAKQAIIRDADKPDSIARHGAETFFMRLGETIQNDPEIRETVNTWMRNAVIRVIVPYRDSIGGFIANVVKNWDPDMVTDKIETSVGRDLQFIRVNGTLVGGMVGLVLHIVWGLIAGH